MTGALSLKTRLTLIILLPLLLISAGVGYWAYQNAQDRAEERFDLSLLSTALAISRDLAGSGGDALSLETRDLIADTSGGPVFYHAYAPDGVFVTGYATPPVPPSGLEDNPQTYFDANYLGNQVRVLRLREPMLIDGLSGVFTFTVWQDTDVRDTFVRDLSGQTFIYIATLIASVALIVWFGIGLGLRPLLDLQNAISKRSTDDLTPIQRQVPVETQGIVKTLNTLLFQVSETIDAKNDFISNAAHQLRNPIAGVLTMAEAVHSAPTPEAAQKRSTDLIDAARRASNLANQLLSFERAKAQPDKSRYTRFDLVGTLRDTIAGLRFGDHGVTTTLTSNQDPIMVTGDPVMIREMLTNLLDNALVHGGLGLSQVTLDVDASTDARITITDNGTGIDPAKADAVLERFGQIEPAKGSGLGLPIAQAIARQHGGDLKLAPSQDGFTVVLRLPL